MFHVLSCQFVYVYQFIRENWRHLKLVFIKVGDGIFLYARIQLIHLFVLWIVDKYGNSNL